MSQLLSLVAQMIGNEAVTDIIYRTDVRTTESWIADADPGIILELPTDGGYLCSEPRILFRLIIFSLLMTQLQHVV